MNQEKKCGSCGQWTAWTGKATDRCTHCNALLDSRTIQEHEEWKEREEAYQKNDFFTPREDDGPLMLATRKVAFVFHLIFGGIAWIFIWAFASTPG
jgi:hypothetical protein